MYSLCQFSEADRLPISILHQANNCFFLILNHEFWLKVTCRYVVLSHSYLSLHYKVVYVHVSGEVNSNNVYRSAFSAVALYRIGWKFVNNFESCSRKKLLAFLKTALLSSVKPEQLKWAFK